MLRLEKLELRGFKSFCDPTEIVFHSGITMIVGPNGCGKSNILDAIVWVLGEQSARSLRGNKMDDVIFNGTRDRKPLGLAEVTLTLVALEDISPRTPEIDDIDIGGALPPIIDSIPDSRAVPAAPVIASEARVSTIEEMATVEASVAEGGRRDKPDPNIALKRALAARRRLPAIAAGERITICRRLYRSGESEYLMNGHVCRLRDIQDFFSGTGLGGAQYAIIEQGKIGQILSSKPQERRALIEEAAGITKFKAKKHLAELKLEATRQNLIRLNDILAEVNNQLVTLRKQAAKARRYCRLQEQMLHYWRLFFIGGHRRVQNALKEINAELNEASAKEQSLADLLSTREIEYRESQAEARAREEALERMRSQVTNLDIEIERTHNRIAYQQEQQKETALRASEFRRELQATAERTELVEAEIVRLRQDFSRIDQELSLIERGLSGQEAAYRVQLEQLIKFERELDLNRAQLLGEVSKTERLRHLRQQLKENLKRIGLQQQSLKNEAARADERHRHCESEYERLCAEVTARENLLDRLGTELKNVFARLEAEVQAADAEKALLDELIREYSRTEDRLGALMKLDEQRSYFSEAVQQLMANEEARREYHILGTLADFLDVEPQYEAMVERVLGEWLQSVMVPTVDDAVGAARWLEEREGGLTTFLVVGLHGASGSIEQIGSALGGAERESERDSNKEVRNGLPTLLAVIGVREEIEGVVRRGLGEIAEAVIAKDLMGALELSRSGGVVITRRGEQVRGRTAVVAGGERGKGEGVLELKREIKELRRYREELKERVEEVEVEERERKIRELEGERNKLDEQIRREERELAGQRVEKNQNEQELERACQHIRVVIAEREQSEQELQQYEKNLEEVEEELEEAEKRKEEIEGKLEQLKEEMGKLKAELESGAEGLAQMRAERAAKQERNRARGVEQRRLEEQWGQLGRGRERLEFELVQIECRSRELNESLAEGETALKALEKGREVAVLEKDAEEAQLIAARKTAEGLEAELERLRKELEQARERRARVEIERARLEVEMGHLEEACRKELAEDLKLVVAREVELESFDAEGLDIEGVRRKIEELGPINMMALDEIAECEEREKFLKEQYEDCRESKERTEEALEELGRRVGERFKGTFEEINSEFRKQFGELFGGGRGEMIIIEDGDESGIEIIAQPPGKRLQSVKLLSGGEKALVALALVLAIMRWRPSPFCVMDEVDGPLDDENLVRLREKIEELSEKAQFVVITHSKVTMEGAERVYGITMEEEGVSKLISARFG